MHLAKKEAVLSIYNEQSEIVGEFRKNGGGRMIPYKLELMTEDQVAELFGGPQENV